ncbi:MAG: LCP family protein [Ilumatobacter sp.]|uniref:LCP family protein n=1 Tax=Ilumatobacter sp. TaxID=1967498 RepID=UPI00391C6325
MQQPIDQGSPPRRRRRSSAWLGLVFAVATAVAGATGVITAADRQVGDVSRLTEFDDPDRRAELGDVLVAVDGPAVNYLIIGSDSREGADPTSGDFGAIGDQSVVQGRRSDTVMILRQEEDGNGAAILSLPRDLWVTIADTGQPQRINSAYNRGADVLAATVSREFGIPINHVVDVDFFGFKALVEQIGGTTICFDFQTRDVNSGLNQPPGCNLLDGDQALAYARSRNYEEFRDGQWRKDPTADLGRITRQQQFISTTVNQTIERLQSDPFLASDLIGATTDTLRLDPNLDPLGAAGTLRKAFGQGLTTYQLPVEGATINGNSVLLLIDNEESRAILDYFRGVGPLPPVAADTDG